MATLTEWENNLTEQTTEDLTAIGAALTTLNDWVLFRTNYPEIKTLGTIAEYVHKDNIIVLKRLVSLAA